MNETFEFESYGVPVKVKRLDYGIQVGCFLYQPADANYRVLDALLSRNAALEAELAAANNEKALATIKLLAVTGELKGQRPSFPVQEGEQAWSDALGLAENIMKELAAAKAECEKHGQ